VKLFLRAGILLSALAAATALLAPAGPAAAKAPPARAAQVHPVSGLRVIPLAVRGHVLRVEVAQTEAEQQMGLMFRKEMGANEGMIFPMNPPRTAAFWMRNTILPLDIVFVGADRRVLNVVHAVPYDETPLPSSGKAGMVLEINAGRAAQLGIRPGTVLKW